MTPMAMTSAEIGIPHDERAKRLGLCLLGGLLIGLAASLPLAAAWPGAMGPPPVGVCLFGTETNPMERIWVKGKIIPLPCMPTFVFIQPAVGGGFLGAGCVFGLIAHRLAGRGSKVLLAVLGGSCLFLLSFLGMLFVPGIPGPPLPLFFSSSIAEPFAVMAFGISFLFALALGLALGTHGLLWRAFLSALVTAACYWLVAWFLLGHGVMIWSHDLTTPPLAHSLPELGNGMGPMLKSVLISNLIAGTLGGWATLFLLAVHDAHTAKTLNRAQPASISGG